jgi:hypothetical protein
MTATRLVGVVLAAAVAVTAVTIVAARIALGRRITGEIAALLNDAVTSCPATVTGEAVDALPEPVARWLRYARVPGTRRPSTVRLTQAGEFRLGRGWVPFSAEQDFTTDPPGFLWKATFQMAPFVSVTGRDQYRKGEGSIDMRALSLIRVARRHGGGLNQGAMLRYLGEIQWFPAGALASYVRWEAIDPHSARATMTDGGVSASMTFTFAPDGRLLESRALRYNDSTGRNESWINRNTAEQDVGGIRVPSAGEARWEYASGPYPYIRWRITDLRQAY